MTATTPSGPTPSRVEYQLHAECTTVWDIHWLAATLDDGNRTLLNLPRFSGEADKAIESTIFVEYNHDSGDRERSESGAFGSIVPNVRIAKYGYQRCNDAVTARVAQGMSRAEAMEKTFVLPGLEDKKPSIRLHAVLACGANVNEATFGSGSQFVPIDVTCEGKPIPPTTTPADPRPPVAKLKPKIKVTSTSLTLSPPKHTGACPVDIKLNGKIVADRAGTVEYRWENDKGDQSETLSQAFGAADSRNVSTTVRIGKRLGSTLGDLKLPGSLDDDGASNDGQYNGTFKLVILSEVANNAARDAEAGYAVQCQAGDPDLTPGAIFSIGGKSAVRGGTVELTASNASGTVGGDCLFKFGYDQTNKTAFPAEGYTNIVQVQILDHKVENPDAQGQPVAQGARRTADSRWRARGEAAARLRQQGEGSQRRQ